MRAGELLRLLRRLAHRRGWSYDWRPDLGKGSHGRLIINGRRTIVLYLKAELKTGTLRAILRDLEIAAEDLSRDKE
jgi:predicted RNA binding protein YcfA (HicA-like mRNA interferase family)